MATYRSIARLYSWKGLFTQVLHYCKKCESCQSRRSPRGEYPSSNRPTSDTPFHTVASDFSGALGPPTGKERYRYFLVFVDQLTRWLILAPVKAPTTAKLIKALETLVMPFHGYMEVLISDQGSAYTSNDFKSTAKKEISN